MKMIVDVEDEGVKLKIKLCISTVYNSCFDPLLIFSANQHSTTLAS